jgi:hypothetical protein
MEPATETRIAARTGSSAAALMPIGKPSDAPAPHSRAPASASGTLMPETTSSKPAAAAAAVPRSTATRPHFSIAYPPNSRDIVIAATKKPKPIAPMVSVAS